MKPGKDRFIIRHLTKTNNKPMIEGHPKHLELKSFEYEIDKVVDALISAGYYLPVSIVCMGTLNVDRDELIQKIAHYKYTGKKIPKSVIKFLNIKYAITYRGINLFIV